MFKPPLCILHILTSRQQLPSSVSTRDRQTSSGTVKENQLGLDVTPEPPTEAPGWTPRPGGTGDWLGSPRALAGGEAPGGSAGVGVLLCCSLIGPGGWGTCRTGRKGSADPGHSGDDRAGLGSKGPRDARPRSGRPAAKPSGTAHTAPGGAGRPAALTAWSARRAAALGRSCLWRRWWWSSRRWAPPSRSARRRTGSSRATGRCSSWRPFPPGPRLPHSHFRLCFPRPTSPRPPAHRVRTSRPAPFPVLRRERARSHTLWVPPTGRPCTRRKAVLSVNPPIIKEHGGWALPRGGGGRPASSTAQLFHGLCGLVGK